MCTTGYRTLQCVKSADASMDNEGIIGACAAYSARIILQNGVGVDSQKNAQDYVFP